jgi:RNase H-like domain found in reverse transcriptase
MESGLSSGFSDSRISTAGSSSYSAVVTPMTKLLRKDVGWSWEPEQAKSFETLKKAFTSALLLAYYDYTKKTVVETDASNWASGGVLSQCDDDNKMRPVTFFSAKHSAAECIYEIYDKELLAIVKALEEWRPELDKPFEIITDHKNLQTFMATKHLTNAKCAGLSPSPSLTSSSSTAQEAKLPSPMPLVASQV